jgi:3-methyladenine DNA glycosylase AlkC
MTDQTAPALKEIFNRARFRHIATEMHAVYPAFDEKRFLNRVTQDLDALSILQRLRQTAESLHEVLPADFTQSIVILKKAAPRLNHSFAAAVLSDYTALYGQDHFDVAMAALQFFTPFGSAEFAIRAFLQRDFARTITIMERWAHDDDEHVRRLASEGSRPRLPWSGKLAPVIADPALTWTILDTLKADPSEYVRRSVANHLNDITKDNPAWMLARIRNWPLDQPHTARIVKHALRSLIKQGDPTALGLIGATGKAQVRIDDFTIGPRRIRLGESITLSCRITSTSQEPQRLVVDYAIHYVKKSGDTSRKVFKLKEIRLAPKANDQITRSQTIRDFTTRTHHPGRHAVELLVNGECLARRYFDLAG